MLPRAFTTTSFIAALLWCGSVSAQDLRKYTIHPFSSEKTQLQGLFDIYLDYRPESNWDDFIADNSQFADLTLQSMVALSTPFFIHRRYCEMELKAGERSQVSVSPTTISPENNDIVEVPVSVLFQFYGNHRDDVSFQEFLNCNKHFGDVSISDKVPLGEDGISLWTIDLTDR